jgi:hypothetical protein
MDLGETIRIWRRRWFLTLMLLTLALAGSVAALIGLPRVYTANSSLVLLASRSAAKLTGGNPYLSFSPSLTLTADALSRELMSQGTINHLAATGFSDTYTVELAPYTTTTTGSVLLVTATGNDKTAVERTLIGVTSEIKLELSQLQRGVGPRSRIRTATLSFSPQATLSASQTARLLVPVIVPSLLLALGIPVMAEGRATRRRIRRMLPKEPSGRGGRLAHGPRVPAGRQRTPDDWPSAENGGRPHRVRTGD